MAPQTLLSTSWSRGSWSLRRLQPGRGGGCLGSVVGPAHRRPGRAAGLGLFSGRVLMAQEAARPRAPPPGRARAGQVARYLGAWGPHGWGAGRRPGPRGWESRSQSGAGPAGKDQGPNRDQGPGPSVRAPAGNGWAPGSPVPGSEGLPESRSEAGPGSRRRHAPQLAAGGRRGGPIEGEQRARPRGQGVAGRRPLPGEPALFTLPEQSGQYSD